MMNTLKCVECEIETKSEDFAVKCPICDGVMVKKEEYKRARREYILAKLGGDN